MAYTSWSVVYGEQPSAAKWNILGTNDASFNDGTGIADGVIKPEHLKNGSSTLNSWVWDTWTPTLSGLFADAKWNKTCAYSRSGDTIHFRLKLVANTTTPMSGAGDAIFTLPVTAIDYAPNVDSAFNIGTGGSCDDSGNFAHFTTCNIVSTTTAELKIHSSGGTYVGVDAMTSTAPMTWTTSDEIDISGAYQAAA